MQQDDLAQRWQQIKDSWHSPFFWLVLLLMFFNWALEARKWQLLIAPLQPLSFVTSFKAIMAGCSITMLTPNRIGEYGGRIIFVNEEHRLPAISLTILGSISQLIVTFIAGTAGLIVLQYSAQDVEAFKMIPALFSKTLLVVSILFTAGSILFYMRMGFLVLLLKRAGILKKFLRHLEAVQFIGRKQLLRIFILSVVRYLVFILQYMLMLYVMGVGVNVFLSFWLLTIFYLLMALAPTIGFTELPIRATASVELFALYSKNVLGIQAAALGIWIINLVIPAVIGSFLILGTKLYKKNDDSIP